MRPLTTLTVTVVLTVLAAPGLAQAPPAEVLQGIEKAGTFSDNFVGSYRTVVNAVISKPNGSGREENQAEMLVTRNADGSQVETIVRSSKNGKDTTAETRAKQEKSKSAKSEKKDKEDSDEGFSVGLGIPGPKTAEHFVYQKLPSQGDICQVSYAPNEQHRKDEGISKGELAWKCDTLEPVLAVASPADRPTGISELTIRMELARAGETAYIAKLTTDGVGGILFIKRKFHMTMEIFEVTPATATPPTQASSH